MITWQFWVLMFVIYLSADRIGDAIERMHRDDDRKKGEK